MSSHRDHHCHHHEHEDECFRPGDAADAFAEVTGGLARLSSGLLACAGQALCDAGQALEHLGRCACPCHARHDHGHCRCPCHHPPAPGTGNPNRPTRHPGTSTGPLTGAPLTPGQVTNPLPPRTWPGTRPQLWLPYLFLRANPGDTGTRPVVGPFWESPDIYILAGVPPGTAPDVPSSARPGGAGRSGQHGVRARVESRPCRSPQRLRGVRLVQPGSRRRCRRDHQDRLHLDHAWRPRRRGRTVSLSARRAGSPPSSTAGTNAYSCVHSTGQPTR